MTISEFNDKRTTVNHAVESVPTIKENLESVINRLKEVNIDQDVYNEILANYNRVYHHVLNMESQCRSYIQLLDDIARHSSITWPPKCTKTNKGEA